VQEIGLRIVERVEGPDDPFEQPIGEPGISREYRAVQVGTDDAPVHRAVGREPARGRARTERARACTGSRHPAVVLEPHDPTGVELLVAYRDFTDQT
jgi:hypothetical protein